MCDILMLVHLVEFVESRRRRHIRSIIIRLNLCTARSATRSILSSHLIAWCNIEWVWTNECVRMRNWTEKKLGISRRGKKRREKRLKSHNYSILAVRTTYSSHIHSSTGTGYSVHVQCSCTNGSYFTWNCVRVRCTRLSVYGYVCRIVSVCESASAYMSSSSDT